MNEIYAICDAIEEVVDNYEQWGRDYEYDPAKNEYIHLANRSIENEITKDWFNI